MIEEGGSLTHLPRGDVELVRVWDVGVLRSLESGREVEVVIISVQSGCREAAVGTRVEVQITIKKYIIKGEVQYWVRGRLQMDTHDKLTWWFNWIEATMRADA